MGKSRNLSESSLSTEQGVHKQCLPYLKEWALGNCQETLDLGKLRSYRDLRGGEGENISSKPMKGLMNIYVQVFLK